MSRPTVSADKYGPRFEFNEKRVKTKLTITMDEEDVLWFKAYAAERGTTMMKIVREYILSLKESET